MCATQLCLGKALKCYDIINSMKIGIEPQPQFAANYIVIVWVKEKYGKLYYLARLWQSCRILAAIQILMETYGLHMQ